MTQCPLVLLTHIALILLVLILILILAVDEAVGEDAAKQERDRGDVDGDVVDGHLHYWRKSNFLNSGKHFVRTVFLLVPTTVDWCPRKLW